ncbi:MAG TPA: hypothetical protein VKV95_00055, partial [Terriglobia bacterium]|nr:hypothetical protein [Terriglobia bacterium]
VFSYVWQTKDFKSFVFVSVANKGLTGAFFVCAASKGLSGNLRLSEGWKGCRKANGQRRTKHQSRIT